MRNYLNFKILILVIGVLLNYSCDRSPKIEWEKKISWAVLDDATDIKQTNDGGYIILGTSNVSKPTLVKINATGNTQWVNVFHDYYDKSPKAIQQTNDGGYIVVGFQSYGLNQNFWVSKLDKIGNVVWSKEYDDGANREVIIAIESTDDDGYIIVGERLNNVDNTFSSDYWVAKIDNQGLLSWSKVLGGSNFDTPLNMHKTKKGSFIIEGKTYSEDGDVPGKMLEKKIESYDIWSVEISNNGEITNSERKESYYFQEKKMIRTDNGTYVLAGKKWIGDTSGSVDLELEKRDLNLNLIWSKIIGGPGKDESTAIQQTSDGGYIVLAKINHKDNSKQWIIKLSPEQ